MAAEVVSDGEDEEKIDEEGEEEELEGDEEEEHDGEDKEHDGEDKDDGPKTAAYYSGYDAETHCGWRCEVGRPATEKEFTNEFQYDKEGSADEDQVACVFKDGSTLLLAGLTVGMIKSKEAATATIRASGAYWISEDCLWQVRVKADRHRLAFLKGPGKSSQICQVKVKFCNTEKEACELIKTIAVELIAETLENTKEEIYKRRDELLEAAASAPAASTTKPAASMKKPAASTTKPAASTKKPATSKRPSAATAADATDVEASAPSTPKAKHSRSAGKAHAKAPHEVPGMQTAFGFSVDALAGMDEAMSLLALRP
jgi:hypothetical protein